MSPVARPVFTEVDLTADMAAPPAWTPGAYFNGSDSSVINMYSPVIDPARGQRSSLLGLHMSPEFPYKPQTSTAACSRLPRSTAYLILVCCVIAVTSLGLLAYVSL